MHFTKMQKITLVDAISDALGKKLSFVV